MLLAPLRLLMAAGVCIADTSIMGSSSLPAMLLAGWLWLPEGAAECSMEVAAPEAWLSTCAAGRLIHCRLPLPCPATTGSTKGSTTTEDAPPELAAWLILLVLRGADAAPAVPLVLTVPASLAYLELPALVASVAAAACAIPALLAAPLLAPYLWVMPASTALLLAGRCCW
jgi:hypothetical protein